MKTRAEQANEFLNDAGLEYDGLANLESGVCKQLEIAGFPVVEIEIDMQDTYYGKPRMQERSRWYIFADGSCLNEDWEEPAPSLEQAQDWYNERCWSGDGMEP